MVTRLGEGLAAAGGLTAASMGRTVDAIQDLVADARRSGPVDIVAVGTAGLRQAPNRDDFLAAVHRHCGVTVEVISGREEARLAYVAAVSTLPLSGDRLLVFDSGGGSSQFTFGGADRIDEQFSVDVGAVRFAERFGLAAAVPRETVDAALDAIAADLTALAGTPATGHGDRDRRHLHQPGRHQRTASTATTRRRPRNGHGRGRGRPADRGLPDPLGGRAARDRRPAAGPGRGDPCRGVHRPHRSSRSTGQES